MDVKVYAGNPETILNKLGDEIINALQKEGIYPTGIHIIAMFRVVVSSVIVGSQHPELGNMPSFSLLLSLLTRCLTQTKLSREEQEAFEKEFIAMVESLGGTVTNAGAVSSAANLFMAPTSKEIH